MLALNLDAGIISPGIPSSDNSITGTEPAASSSSNLFELLLKALTGDELPSMPAGRLPVAATDDPNSTNKAPKKEERNGDDAPVFAVPILVLSTPAPLPRKLPEPFSPPASSPPPDPVLARPTETHLSLHADRVGPAAVVFQIAAGATPVQQPAGTIIGPRFETPVASPVESPAPVSTPVPQKIVFTALIVPEHVEPAVAVNDRNESPRITTTRRVDPLPMLSAIERLSNASYTGAESPAEGILTNPAIARTFRIAQPADPSPIPGTNIALPAGGEAKIRSICDNKPAPIHDSREKAGLVIDSSGPDWLAPLEERAPPVAAPHGPAMGAPDTGADDSRRKPPAEPAPLNMGSQPVTTDSTGAISAILTPPPATAHKAPTPQLEETRPSTAPSKTETNATMQSPPIREISLRLGQADSSKVDIKLSERAGQVHVAVRSDDRELTKSLQADLGDLVSRLEAKGYKTDAWAAGPRIGGNHGLEHEVNSGAEGRFSSSPQGQDPQSGRDSHRRQRPQWEWADDSFRLEPQETETDDNRPH